jgi:hypothetical protein
MTAVNILLAILGGGITVMVAVGMIFLTPRGMEPHVETPLEQPRPMDQPEVGRDPDAVLPETIVPG